MAYAYEGFVINEFRNTELVYEGQMIPGLTFSTEVLQIPRYAFDNYGALDTDIKVCRIGVCS